MKSRETILLKMPLLVIESEMFLCDLILLKNLDLDFELLGFNTQRFLIEYQLLKTSNYLKLAFTISWAKKRPLD
jgi:hypothetical protein